LILFNDDKDKLGSGVVQLIETVHQKLQQSPGPTIHHPSTAIATAVIVVPLFSCVWWQCEGDADTGVGTQGRCVQ
jgi:hypothetical protein